MTERQRALNLLRRIEHSLYARMARIRHRSIIPRVLVWLEQLKSDRGARER